MGLLNGSNPRSMERAFDIYSMGVVEPRAFECVFAVMAVSQAVDTDTRIDADDEPGAGRRAHRP